MKELKKIIIALMTLIITMAVITNTCVHNETPTHLNQSGNASSSKVTTTTKSKSYYKGSSSASTSDSVGEYDTVPQYIIDFDEPKRICNLCGGAGYEECSACDGTGKSSIYSHLDGTLKTFSSPRCEVCNGKGRIKCAWCHGSGWVD